VQRCNCGGAACKSERHHYGWQVAASGCGWQAVINSRGNRRPEDWLGAQIKRCAKVQIGAELLCKSAKVGAAEPPGGTWAR